jgi:hypothetical protein
MTELTWTFTPDVPRRDLLWTYDLSDMGCMGMLLDDLVWLLERKEFQTWEAVIRQEQGLPLSELHRSLLARLLDFGDEPGSRILSIDGLPRPKEPWYATVRRVVPHLLVQPFRTFDIHYEEVTEGWPRLAAALEEHGEGLSLPAGVSRPVEVVPTELRHRLWLQSCLDALSGLGQEPELTLADPEEHYRIDEFVANLRRCRESVGFLGLTLDGLLSVVVLPDADVPLFVEAMKDRLGLSSGEEPLADRL